MTTFAIFDRNIGFVEWIGEAEHELAAFKAYKADVFPDFDEIDISDCDIRTVTPEQADALREWSAKGSPASEFPL